MTDSYLFYNDVYRGAEIPKDEFPRYYSRAEEVVSAITFGRADIDCDEVKKAVCAQTEYLYSIGEGCFAGSGGDVSREEVGTAAISYRKPDGVTYNGLPVSAVCLAILSASGALYRGI